MLVAQITDIHLGFDPGNPDEYNRRRLDRTLAALAALNPRPDLLFATGDIADKGDDAVSYRRFAEAIAGLPFPVHAVMGNHDSRAAFLATFPATPVVDGYIQYAIDDYPVRILALDTLEAGRHGGGYDAARARWLSERLAEAPERPTMLVLHHPPVETGLSWMTENPEAGWVLRLRAIVEAHPNIVAMIAGHLHRPLVARWAGTTLAVCPATAPQVVLDMAPIDPEAPDGRPMIVADRPYFALHHWNGRELVSHFGTAGDDEILSAFGPNWQDLLRRLKAERA